MSTDLTPDQAAAHAFLTELRTRIATQPVPYQYGVEARALTSLWEIFDHARSAIDGHPGCEDFAVRATDVLNTVVRPLTAKWHRAHEEGRLASRDGADAFRGELQRVQQELRAFAEELHAMAYGQPRTDARTPPVMSPDDLRALFGPLDYGFRAHCPELEAVAEKIRAEERAAVRARREAHGLAAESQDAIGLAFSGGGIRSATFCLGVAQVLAHRGLLKEVDFLSTVSGGGYTGSFLTQRLGDGEAHASVAGPHGPDPEPVRYVRQNTRFLSGANLKERWGMVTATLAGLALNASGPIFLLIAFALAAHGIKMTAGDTVAKYVSILLPGLPLLCAAATVLYAWGVRQEAAVSRWTGWVLGAVLAASAACGVLWAIHAIFSGMPERLQQLARATTFSAALALAAAAVPVVMRFLPVLRAPATRRIVLKVALLAAALLVPVVAVLGFYILFDLAASYHTELAALALALAVISILLLNINLTSPHRLYRDGLARTFIQRTPDGSPIARLADINPRGTAPYHLLNAAQNVPSSTTAALKDRGCDFFLFSKHWMGSASSGYAPTRSWQANGDHVDLATAMAVSGAAVAPHMGLGSMPALTMLLTLLNVRLGFWIRRPGAAGVFRVPGLTCLLRETLRAGMTENARWLNLSDGGHIENLAVYELLRRRCKFIVCVDGEADPAFTFHGLMTLVRHAQIDFGIRLAPRLDELRPDPTTGRSRCHFHLCRIHYPEGTGLLLYVKLSVTGNESELIRRYRGTHPDFPHQATLDQFFDQEQFEAYRQLGVHVAEALFLPALMDGTTPGSIRAWFEQLAKNLLEPSPSGPDRRSAGTN
jgi:hypothetical protein